MIIPANNNDAGYASGFADGYKRGQADSDRQTCTWLTKEVFYQDEVCRPIEAWQSMKCSKCGHYYTSPYMYYISEPNYCPHCGAKTKGD